MQFHFIGRNIEVTPSLKTYTTDKFQPITKHYGQITHVNVIFKVEHLTQTAEATLHYDGTEIHATANAGDMYDAVNALIDKLSNQLHKHKEKH